MYDVINDERESHVQKLAFRGGIFFKVHASTHVAVKIIQNEKYSKNLPIIGKRNRKLRKKGKESKVKETRILLECTRDTFCWKLDQGRL